MCLLQELSLLSYYTDNIAFRTACGCQRFRLARRSRSSHWAKDDLTMTTIAIEQDDPALDGPSKLVFGQTAFV